MGPSHALVQYWYEGRLSEATRVVARQLPIPFLEKLATCLLRVDAGYPFPREVQSEVVLSAVRVKLESSLDVKHSAFVVFVAICLFSHIVYFPIIRQLRIEEAEEEGDLWPML